MDLPPSASPRHHAGDVPLPPAVPAPSARGVGSPWRSTAAALAAVAAFAHVPVIPDHLEDALYLGIAFTTFTLASLGLAVVLLRRDVRPAWWAALVLPAAAITTFVASRTMGLPAAGDDVGAWGEPLAVVSLVSEGALVLLAGAVLATTGHRAHPARPGRPWQAALAAVTLLAGTGGTIAAASAQDATTAGMAGHAMAGHATTGATSGSTTGSTAGMQMGDGSSMSSDDYWSKVGGAAFSPTGVTRTYYLGADEVPWNYAPTGKNQVNGKPFDETADTYVRSGPGRIGATYLKCLYRGYTDAGFGTLQQRPADDAYLGFTGPVIRAEVGDTIKVVFRNGCRIGASVHPHGVFYEKASEGAPYADNTSGKDTLDDAVPQGGTHTYTWLVPDRAGPGPHDGSSVMWMYHSHTDEVGDTYAGLQGFMVITGKGQAKPDGTPKDVDREVFELFSVMNENNSPYLQENLRRYAKRPFPKPDDEEFAESNLMHSINGFVFGNQPMLTLKKGERVRWYVMSMGTEVDLHTPHWHGNDVVVNGMRMDVVSLLPASMVTADMVPDDPGIWLFHCHVNDHLTAGMVTRYQVAA